MYQIVKTVLLKGSTLENESSNLVIIFCHMFHNSEWKWAVF